MASIEASNFKPVWDVIKALRAHDEILAETLDQYRTNMAKTNSTNGAGIGDKVIFDIPTRVGVEFSSALRTALVEASTASWEFWYGLLEVFKEREGHTNVFKRHKEGDFKLGFWVSNQRSTKDTLTPERIEKLEALGFVWDILVEQWEEGFNKLEQFKEREGHLKVPRGHKEDNINLGLWVGRQRKIKDTLTPERIERLEALGFVWDILAEQWEESFSRLEQFKEREGHCKVPKGYKEDGLGLWVLNQRRQREKLTPERIERLNALGFVWDIMSEQWEEGFTKLQKFKEIEGHCRVPGNYKLSDFSLARWVYSQRKNKDNLSSERFERLNSLGFSWDPLSEYWEEGFAMLQQFNEHNGHCRIPAGYKTNNFSLGSWVRSQRKNKDSLTPERLERLNSLGFVWGLESD